MLPIEKSNPRPSSAQMLKSTESGWAIVAPPVVSGTPEGGTAGGPETPESRPGISPAFCQPAMPSVQTSVSAVTVPLAMNSRS
jgi:hypothetical protein